MALRDPDAGPELAALLGKPLDQPERDKARAIVAGSSAIDATVAAARLHVDQPSTRSKACSSADLRRALSELVHGLVDQMGEPSPEAQRQLEAQLLKRPKRS